MTEPASGKIPVYEVGRLARAVLEAVGTVVVGKRDALELVLAGILAGGHVLLEDLPGLGKTLTARSFAQALGLHFRRLQFTPDLLPADVTGSFLYDQRNHEFTFRPGPVFTNLLLADEINRTPPKTQAALLEGMQERQVSVEGVTYRLEPPFCVLATANPIEYEGTYPLPEAQLDRFMLRVSFGYPGAEDEWEVLRRRIARQREESVVVPVTDARTLLAMQYALESVAVEDSIGRYIVTLTAATRDHPSVLVGASPRGSLALLQLARAKAALNGRDYVIPEDVKAVAVPALAHRMTLRPEMWLRRVDPSFVVGEVLSRTPAPASGALPTYGGGFAGQEPTGARQAPAMPHRDAAVGAPRDPGLMSGGDPGTYPGRDPATYPGRDATMYPGGEAANYPGRDAAMYPGPAAVPQGRDTAMMSGRDPAMAMSQAPTEPPPRDSLRMFQRGPTSAPPADPTLTPPQDAAALPPRA